MLNKLKEELELRNNPVIQRLLIIILCIIVLLPNYQINVAAGNQVNTISDSTELTSLSDENTEQNNTEFTIPAPKDIVSAASAVYDSQIPKELAEIKALSIQRKTLKGYRQDLTFTPNRVDDLKKEEIEKLVLAGASIVDVYWINLIVKESTLSPMDILEFKKMGRSLGKTLRSKYEIMFSIYRPRLKIQYIRMLLQLSSL